MSELNHYCTGSPVACFCSPTKESQVQGMCICVLLGLLRRIPSQAHLCSGSRQESDVCYACLPCTVCLSRAVLHCLVSFPVSTCDVFSLCTARHTLPGTHCQTHGDCTVYLSASSLCMCVPQVSWVTGAQDTGKCPSCRAIIHRSSGCKRAPSTALQQL